MAKQFQTTIQNDLVSFPSAQVRLVESPIGGATIVKASLMLQNFNLKKSNQELLKQNAELRKENTELKAKIDIPVDGKEYNGKPNQIQNIP